MAMASKSPGVSRYSPGVPCLSGSTQANPERLRAGKRGLQPGPCDLAQQLPVTSAESKAVLGSVGDEFELVWACMKDAAARGKMELGVINFISFGK